MHVNNIHRRTHAHTHTHTHTHTRARALTHPLVRSLTHARTHARARVGMRHSSPSLSFSKRFALDPQSLLLSLRTSLATSSTSMTSLRSNTAHSGRSEPYTCVDPPPCVNGALWTVSSRFHAHSFKIITSTIVTCSQHHNAPTHPHSPTHLHSLTHPLTHRLLISRAFNRCSGVLCRLQIRLRLMS
jgi:hypothetical protein